MDKLDVGQVWVPAVRDKFNREITGRTFFGFVEYDGRMTGIECTDKAFCRWIERTGAKLEEGEI